MVGFPYSANFKAVFNPLVKIIKCSISHKNGHSSYTVVLESKYMHIPGAIKSFAKEAIVLFLITFSLLRKNCDGSTVLKLFKIISPCNLLTRPCFSRKITSLRTVEILEKVILAKSSVRILFLLCIILVISINLSCFSIIYHLPLIIYILKLAQF